MSRLENILKENYFEYGIPYDHPKARELAELQIEDLTITAVERLPPL